MTAGMARCMALSAGALLLAASASAQRPGAVEIGALARFTDFDNNLGMRNTVGAGGRLAVYVRPRLAFELDMSRTSSDRSAGSATYTPLHARLVVSLGRPGRVEGQLGAGYVHNAYRGSLDATDGGLTGSSVCVISLTAACGCASGPTSTSCSTRRRIVPSPFTTATGAPPRRRSPAQRRPVRSVAIMASP